MAEEKETKQQETTNSAPTQAEKPKEKRPPTPAQRKRSQRSVFQYITILFAAAFVLMLYTFLMERRQNNMILQQNQEQIDQLEKNTNSATERLSALIDQRDQLMEENESLEQELEELQAQVDALTDAQEHQEQVSTQTQMAMDYFWQVDEAYVLGRYSLCRRLISVLEDDSQGQTPLKTYLPTETYTNNGRFSPAGRYEEIYNALY